MINSNVSDEGIDCANCHCAAQLLSVLLDRDSDTWDHELSEIASYTDTAITSEFIEDN